MELTKKKVEKILNVGEDIYMIQDDELRRTKVIAIEDIGLDTELDFLPYDEHVVSWWFTFIEAEKQMGRGGNAQ